MIKVAIYDSGVGGLSIFQELYAACPAFEYVFVSDNEAYPYGTKPEDELLRRVLDVSARIIESESPDILVLACNTASTVCLPSLRERYTIPVVGVVPAIKPAAAISVSKIVGLLATPATIDRPYTNSLIKEFASDCQFIRVGSTALVDMAEAKLRGDFIDLDQLETILRPFIDTPKLDVLALACTHFPLLKDEIESVFRKNSKTVTLVDSGAAIANRVHSLASSLGTSSANGLESTLENSLAECSVKDLHDNLNLNLNLVVQDHNHAASINNLAAFTAPVTSRHFLENLKNIGFAEIIQLDIQLDIHT